MNLETLRPAKGATKKAKRIGRGEASGKGGTSTKGNKGGQSRAGYKIKMGFEGGQMPIQRRLPKHGFASPTADDTAEVRLDTLQKLHGQVIDMALLKAADLVPKAVKRVKVIASGKLAAAVTTRGLAVTKGARAAIEAVGGKIED